MRPRSDHDEGLGKVDLLQRDLLVANHGPLTGEDEHRGYHHFSVDAPLSNLDQEAALEEGERRAGQHPLGTDALLVDVELHMPDEALAWDDLELEHVTQLPSCLLAHSFFLASQSTGVVHFSVLPTLGPVDALLAIQQ